MVRINVAPPMRPLCVLILLWFCVDGGNARVDARDTEDRGNSPPSRDAAEMTARVDALLAEKWEAESVVPASLASDAEFLRRLYLDLAGTIPSVQQARQFLNDTDPHKRSRLIESMVRSPQHATHMSITWRNRLLPSNFDPTQLNRAAGLQSWLRRQFLANRRYDHLVRDFLVATGAGDRGPGIFYTALELKPRSSPPVPHVSSRSADSVRRMPRSSSRRLVATGVLGVRGLLCPSEPTGSSGIDAGGPGGSRGRGSHGPRVR